MGPHSEARIDDGKVLESCILVDERADDGKVDVRCGELSGARWRSGRGLEGSRRTHSQDRAESVEHKCAVRAANQSTKKATRLCFPNKAVQLEVAASQSQMVSTHNYVPLYGRD